MHINEILSRLDGVIKGADGQRYAKCPAHDDKKASLGVSVGNDGRILLYCHAGCEPEAIAGAMGLQMKDLFPLSDQEQTARNSPVATYEYRNYEGILLCQKLRFANKKFTWRRPDGKSGWIYNRQGVAPVLYNLPAIKDRELVFLVEGEKDVDNLSRHGLPATCSPDGAGGKTKWRDEYSGYLQGKTVVIIPDNDPPGLELATVAANSLLGVAKSVKLIDIKRLAQDLKEHGDISDIMEEYGPEITIDALRVLYKDTEDFKPGGSTAVTELGKGKRLSPLNAIELMRKSFPSLMQPVNNLICEGLTMLVGASKIGKSWLVLQLAIYVASGVSFWGRETTKCRVLYLALEDSMRRLQSRLRTLNMEVPENLSLLTEINMLGEGFEAQLEEWLSREAGPKMVIIDTFQKIRGIASSKDNAYQADYKVIGQLKAIADKHKAAIICVHHTNKLRNVSDPFEKVSGSMAIMGAADTTILINRERGADVATVSMAGRDVWGDDFVIRFENGRWNVEHEDASEYRASNDYEAQPLVQVFRKLAAENPNGGKWTYNQIDAIGLDMLGFMPFTGAKSQNKAVNEFAGEMLRRDGILLTGGVQVTKGEFKGKGVKMEIRSPKTSFQSKITGV